MTTSINDLNKARLILETCLSATDSTTADLGLWEAKDLINEIKDKMNTEADFYLDSLPCGEVRIIDENAIDEIWHDGLIEQIKECYEVDEVLENLPSFVVCEVDWDQTAENCKVDGMGHHFASYDHEEHSTQGFYIFRTK